MGVHGVYGLVRNDNRGEFFLELEAVAFRWSVPWCVGRDYNMMRWPTERVGSSRELGCMRRFCSFIDEMQLINMLLQGGSFTWSNGLSLSRIDRFAIRRNIFRMLFKFGCLVQCLIIGLFYSIVGGSAVAQLFSVLRTCGCIRRVSWRWFGGGGTLLHLQGRLVACWCRS